VGKGVFGVGKLSFAKRPCVTRQQGARDGGVLKGPRGGEIKKKGYPPSEKKKVRGFTKGTGRRKKERKKCGAATWIGLVCFGQGMVIGKGMGKLEIYNKTVSLRRKKSRVGLFAGVEAKTLGVA